MNLNMAEVKSTKNYDLFKRINYNREVMIPRIDKIVESIKKYGFILPILVNGNMMIVDGQHRLEAAKKAGSEVLYIQFPIHDDMLPVLISTVNTTSRNWTLEDHLNMWVALEKETYLYISDIMDRECLGISHFLRLASVSGCEKDVLSKYKFKNGELTFTSSQRYRIETRIKHLNDIRNASISYKEFCNTSAFISAIIVLLVNPDYDHKRMVQVIDESPGSIARSSSSSDYIEIFSSMYNKRLRQRVKFAAS